MDWNNIFRVTILHRMSVLNQTNKFIELEKYNARMYKTGLDLYQEKYGFYLGQEYST